MEIHSISPEFIQRDLETTLHLKGSGLIYHSDLTIELSLFDLESHLLET